MAGSSSQIRRIIDRLIEKTSNSELRWSEGFGRNTISTRLGDYQVSLSRIPLGANVELIVSDILSDQTIKVGGDMAYLVGERTPEELISPEDQEKLNRLFHNIKKQSQTLGGLLKALG